MNIGHKDIRILGALKMEAKTLGDIKDRTGIKSEELEKILGILESSKLITSTAGTGLFGQSKIFIKITENGSGTVGEYVEFLHKKWEEIINFAAAGEREKLEQYMIDNPFLLKNMIFFKVIGLPLLGRLNLRFLLEGKNLCYQCKKELGRFTQKFSIKNCNKFGFKIPSGMTVEDNLCASCFDDLANNI